MLKVDEEDSMKKMRLTGMAAVAVSLLVGCSAVYTPKAGEPVARLRVVTAPTPQYATDQGWSSWLSVEDLSACPASPTSLMKSGEISVVHSPRLGMPGAPGANKLSAEFTLPAGRPLALNALMGEGRWTCEISVRLTPQAGKDYEMEYAVSRAARKCMAPLRELRTGSAGVQRVRVAGVQRLSRGRPCDPAEPDSD